MSGRFGLTTRRRRAPIAYDARPIAKEEFACSGLAQDICAYLRLAQDTKDDQAFRRICNKPTRSIGRATEDAIVDHAMQSNIPYYDALWQIAGAGCGRTVGREELDHLADRLSWLSLGYSHRDWETDEFLDVIFIEGNIGYEKFALSRARSPDDVTATIQMLRRMAAEEPDLTMFLERFPAEWVELTPRISRYWIPSIG